MFVLNSPTTLSVNRLIYEHSGVVDLDHHLEYTRQPRPLSPQDPIPQHRAFSTLRLCHLLPVLRVGCVLLPIERRPTRSTATYIHRRRKECESPWVVHLFGTHRVGDVTRALSRPSTWLITNFKNPKLQTHLANINALKHSLLLV